MIIVPPKRQKPKQRCQACREEVVDLRDHHGRCAKLARLNCSNFRERTGFCRHPAGFHPEVPNGKPKCAGCMAWKKRESVLKRSRILKKALKDVEKEESESSSVSDHSSPETDAIVKDNTESKENGEVATTNQTTKPNGEVYTVTITRGDTVVMRLPLNFP